MSDRSMQPGEHVRYDEHDHGGTIAGHRSEVVRRLLERGVSPTTLSVLLPEFADTIATVNGTR